MEEVSDCCTAHRWCGTDLCGDCKEHADFNELKD